MEKITIEQTGAGKRIDRFLVEEFFLYTRGEVIRKIKRGEAKLNGKDVKPSYTLEIGDEITLENFSREGEDKRLIENKYLPLEILFENENIIVVNKQAGVQIHPSHNEKKKTIVNALIAHYPEIESVHDESEGAELRPGIVHRLDKDTSGVLVVARNTKTLEALKTVFKNREIQKQYLTITKGTFKEKEGQIDKPIARSSSYRKQVIARNNTKTIIREALTKFKVLKEAENFSLVEVSPKTGRMHQIRIHLASIGHPVVGDLIYGENSDNEKTQISAKRQLLHAHKLQFSLFGEQYDFVAPMPEDFEKFMSENGKFELLDK